MQINGYLDERQFIFQPILDYLIEQNAPRTNTELNVDLGTRFCMSTLKAHPNLMTNRWI